MASLQFFFCLTCLLGKIVHVPALKLSSSIDKNSGFISVTAGENLKLKCSSDSEVATRFYWYKQPLGQKLKLISSFYKYDHYGVFHDEFKYDPRLSLYTGTGKNHLTIRDLQISDSATYYCASSYSYKFEFADGFTVIVEGSGSNIPAVVHQSEYGTVHPGNSVTLNCTVHTGTCDEEHRVHWFRDSGEPQPGIIYTHGDRNGQCERKTETQNQTCVYNLPLMNLTHSHAATTYCAVVTCGHILLGTTTKQKVGDRVPSCVLIHLLSGALTFTIILSVLLSVCMIMKKNSCQCPESPSTTNSESHQNGENLHYAALWQPRTKRPVGERNNSKAECVYSSIKQ